MSNAKSTKWLPFHPGETYSRRYVNFFFESHGEKISGRVLDLGSGRDNLERWSAISRDIDSYVAADIAAEASIDVRTDAAQLPFPNETFDTIILSEVLEHIPVTSLEAVTNELYRVLKPGGTVLASTPFIYPEHGPPDHVRLTPDSMNDIFSSAGFGSVTVEKGGGYTESLLQIAFRPVVGILGKFDAESIGWLFAIVHYLFRIGSFIVHTLLTRLAGRNPRADIWFLMTFTIATKDPKSVS